MTHYSKRFFKYIKYTNKDHTQANLTKEHGDRTFTKIDMLS